MNKIILAAIAAALLVAGAFLILNRNTTKEAVITPSTTTAPTKTVSPSPSSTMPESTTAAHVVTLTTSGFEPKTITIKAGAKVVWTNKSGAMGNISSDNHPTHLLYPMLNLGNFKDGGTFGIAFEKPGTYTYHNHLDTSQTGTVVVE